MKPSTCTECENPHLPGVHLCRYHWTVAHWGKDYADLQERKLLAETSEENQWNKPLVLVNGRLERAS